MTSARAGEGRHRSLPPLTPVRRHHSVRAHGAPARARIRRRDRALPRPRLPQLPAPVPAAAGHHRVRGRLAGERLHRGLERAPALPLADASFRRQRPLPASARARASPITGCCPRWPSRPCCGRPATPSWPRTSPSDWPASSPPSADEGWARSSACLRWGPGPRAPSTPSTPIRSTRPRVSTSSRMASSRSPWRADPLSADRRAQTRRPHRRVHAAAGTELELPPPVRGAGDRTGGAGRAGRTAARGRAPPTDAGRATLAAALLFAPVALPYLRSAREQGYVRDLGPGIGLEHYFSTPPTNLFYGAIGTDVRLQQRGPHFVGFLSLALALFALAEWAIRRPRDAGRGRAPAGGLGSGGGGAGAGARTALARVGRDGVGASPGTGTVPAALRLGPRIPARAHSRAPGPPGHALRRPPGRPRSEPPGDARGAAGCSAPRRPHSPRARRSAARQRACARRKARARVRALAGRESRARRGRGPDPRRRAGARGDGGDVLLRLSLEADHPWLHGLPAAAEPVPAARGRAVSLRDVAAGAGAHRRRHRRRASRPAGGRRLARRLRDTGQRNPERSAGSSGSASWTCSTAFPSPSPRAASSGSPASRARRRASTRAPRTRSIACAPPPRRPRRRSPRPPGDRSGLALSHEGRRPRSRRGRRPRDLLARPAVPARRRVLRGHVRPAAPVAGVVLPLRRDSAFPTRFRVAGRVPGGGWTELARLDEGHVLQLVDRLRRIRDTRRWGSISAAGRWRGSVSSWTRRGRASRAGRCRRWRCGFRNERPEGDADAPSAHAPRTVQRVGQPGAAVGLGDETQRVRSRLQPPPDFLSLLHGLRPALPGGHEHADVRRALGHPEPHVGVAARGDAGDRGLVRTWHPAKREGTSLPLGCTE